MRNDCGRSNPRGRDMMSSKLSGLALALAAAIGVVGTACSALAADPPKSVRIGYAISLSGPNAQGAAITTLSGYKLWVDDVNKKGGLKVQGFDKPIPIEVVEYDDTSNAENAVRLVERLMTQDKVDFVLPPWSTGFNLATAPVFARNAYPQLAVTANSNDAANLVKQMPTLFFFLNEPRHFGAALGEVLSKLKSENKINNKIVMLSIADQFGAEFTSGVTPVLQSAGFEFALRKSYPPGTFMLTNTAVTQGYNPKVFHVGVGTAFARYGAVMKEKAEGVMGLGGWDAKAPGAEDYQKRLVALTNQPGDAWAAPVTYASLQVLEQAIEKVGLDRKKLLDAIANGGPYQTIVGPVDLKTHVRGKQWSVGQWQGGQFVGVGPSDLPGAKPIVFPKPAW